MLLRGEPFQPALDAALGGGRDQLRRRFLGVLLFRSHSEARQHSRDNGDDGRAMHADAIVPALLVGKQWHTDGDESADWQRRFVHHSPAFLLRQASEILFDLQFVLRRELLDRRLQHLLAWRVAADMPQSRFIMARVRGGVGLADRCSCRADAANWSWPACCWAVGCRERWASSAADRLRALARLRLALARLALAGLLAGLLDQAVQIVDDLPLKLLRAGAGVGLGDALLGLAHLPGDFAASGCRSPSRRPRPIRVSTAVLVDRLAM